jgi:hypothetical protein
MQQWKLSLKERMRQQLLEQQQQEQQRSIQATGHDERLEQAIEMYGKRRIREGEVRAKRFRPEYVCWQGYGYMCGFDFSCGDGVSAGAAAAGVRVGVEDGDCCV